MSRLWTPGNGAGRTLWLHPGYTNGPAPRAPIAFRRRRALTVAVARPHAHSLPGPRPRELLAGFTLASGGDPVWLVRWPAIAA